MAKLARPFATTVGDFRASEKAAHTEHDLQFGEFGVSSSVNGITMRHTRAVLVAIATVLAGSASAGEPQIMSVRPLDVAKRQWTENPATPRNPPCTCRFRGQDVLLGQSVCMNTSKGYVKARCGRVMNNSSWNFTEQPFDAIS